MGSTYLVAIGSNRRHHLYGRPDDVVHAAMEECAALGTVTARSPIIQTAPIGAAQRRFANAACLIESEFDPASLLAGLKRLEKEFGRRNGRRWGDRVLDCDIILWSDGIYASRELSVPHPQYRKRQFVVTPAMHIAAHWRDPVSGLTLAQTNGRLTRARALPS